MIWTTDTTLTLTNLPGICLFVHQRISEPGEIHSSGQTVPPIGHSIHPAPTASVPRPPKHLAFQQFVSKLTYLENAGIAAFTKGYDGSTKAEGLTLTVKISPDTSAIHCSSFRATTPLLWNIVSPCSRPHCNFDLFTSTDTHWGSTHYFRYSLGID